MPDSSRCGRSRNTDVCVADDLAPVAYICAMDWEAECLPNSANVYVAGIGPERARIAAQRACADGAAIVISFGSAGGLAPELRTGALIVTESVCSENLSHQETDTNRNRLDSHQGLPKQILQALMELSPHCGELYSSRVILNSLTQKQAAYQRTAALAVDMESAEIRQVCQQSHRQFVAVRVVLDDAVSVMPGALVAACDDFGRVKVMKMMLTLLCHPSLWPMLIPLGRAQSKVRQILKSAGCMLENHFSGAVV